MHTRLNGLICWVIAIPGATQACDGLSDQEKLMKRTKEHAFLAFQDLSEDNRLSKAIFFEQGGSVMYSYVSGQVTCP